jgi:hypothetical protein
MYGIKYSSLTMQKGKWCSKGFLRRLIYFTSLNLSPRNAVLSRGTGIVSSKSRTGALVAKTKPMRDTFAPTRSRGSFLGCWPWKAGVSGFTPEFPGLPRILRVLKPQWLYSGWGGYKSPFHPFFTPLSCLFDLNFNSESASRLLVVLVIMTMQLGRINALNEMCAGFKVK